MSTTLPLYWTLSSPSTKDRLDASVKLLGALEVFQEQFTPTTTGLKQQEIEDVVATGDTNEKEVNFETLNAQDVAYSLRRLVRGLASPRESSRLGFAVALTEVRLLHLKVSNDLMRENSC